MKGHTKDNYWKIIGYPPNFKSKKKPRVEEGATFNALLDQDTISEPCSYLQSIEVQTSSGLQMSQLRQMGIATFNKE